MVRNPVMFVVEIVAALTTLLFLRDLVDRRAADYGFSFQINLWLWFTVLFANFAEAVAEGRGKAQAATLAQTQDRDHGQALSGPQATELSSWCPAQSLKPGDVVLVEAGDLIPSDGEVIEGVASVDEAAITGESAPVIRESGGDRSAVTGGTRGLSDWIKVRITAAPGLDLSRPHDRAGRGRRAAEDAERDRAQHPARRHDASSSSSRSRRSRALPPMPAAAISVLVLVALFVTLIPTTIGALLSAIGIAGMDRLVRFNVLAMSGRAVEAAGDVDTLLLDKTGTITLGNRQATEFIPLAGVTEQELADAAQLASLADETPEGRSIVVLAKEKYGIRGRDMAQLNAHFIPFSAQTRISGIDRRGDLDPQGRGRCGAGLCRGGTAAASRRRRGNVARSQPCHDPPRSARSARSPNAIAKAGGTPLAVAKDGRLLGVIHLKDIVKGGIRERFAELRRMGIRTVMITGDNPLTAAAIAAEAGVDDFLAQATPEDKLQLIREEQAQGQARGDVRRRHQRRAGAGPGRCRRRDEHRHHGGARSRQHGRSRQRSDQADRDRRDRQAAADDPRRADHLLDRQRRREIFRDHPGDVRRLLPAAAGVSTSCIWQRRRARSCRRSSSMR